MHANHEYDYIIIGGGLSGLQLAHAFLSDAYFNDKRIAIVEPQEKSQNDKTWSYWEKGPGLWDNVVYKSWTRAKVYGQQNQIDFELGAYTYKSIRSIDFYAEIIPKLKSNPKFDWIQAEALSVTEKKLVEVETTQGILSARHVFDSRIPTEFSQDKKSIKLLQHFKGWVIKTKESVFNAEEFVMMDYRLVHEDSTSFTYVLPFDEHTALVEYTFFSPSKVPKSVYLDNIKTYIASVLNIEDYEVVEKEYGVIPMTNYPFWQHNSSRLTKIGTAGGWVKASSGYSFKNTQNKIKIILDNIKGNRKVDEGLFERKYQFYDAVFLNVLYNENEYGPRLFEDFYKRNTAEDALQFLDEQSTISQDLRIIWSLRSFKFVKAFFRCLFGR